MTNAALNLACPGDGQPWSAQQIAAINPCLEKQDALERLRWASHFLPGQMILSSSFGAQSAVMLHMVTRIQPDIPVVLIDTGYLFAETYRFIDEMTERLSLNLQVFRPRMSAAWQEVRFGQEWNNGVEGIERYNDRNKVHPMQRALSALNTQTWVSGIRRAQSRSRAHLGVLADHHGIVKVHPIIDWGDRDIHRYLKANDLPYHPLWEQGYVSIGDTHSSRPISVGELAEDTRFSGLVRECGLHQPERYG